MKTLYQNFYGKITKDQALVLNFLGLFFLVPLLFRNFSNSMSGHIFTILFCIAWIPILIKSLTQKEVE